MPFLERDVVVAQVDGTTWRLEEDVVYEGRTDRFVVPAGFLTDFASVPRVFVWLLPRYGDYTRSAILHDWLVDQPTVSRRDADGLFRRSMRELGVSLVRRWAMWAAVRAGSGLSGATPKETVQFLLVAVPATAFLLPPAIVVQIWLVAFWGLEVVGWVVQRLLARERTDRPPSMQSRTA